MRRIVNSNIVLAVFIATIIFLLQSCKKTDHFRQSSNEEYEQMFFMGSTNTHDIVTRIARSLQAQNNETHFVVSMAINEGFAKWSKAMMETNGTDSIVLLPLVLKGTQYVNSFLVSKLNGGTINTTLVQGKNYTKYGYDGDKMALLFMHLNKAVFGATIFDATNSTVFSIGEVEEKMGKRSIQIGFYTREKKMGARSLLTTSSTSLNTLELIDEDPASVLIKKCSGVVYMQDGLIVSTSGDLSCGPTIVELPSQPGTPLVPTEPIPVGPTDPTTPTGGDPATSYPPVKPIIITTNFDNDDPCLIAKPFAEKVTELSKTESFSIALNDIEKAISADGATKKEHSITFGKDGNNNIIASSVTTGGTSSGTVNTSFPGAFADIHNHNNDLPPSSGDIYGYIDLSKNNTSYIRFVITLYDDVYAIALISPFSASKFNIDFPRVYPPQGTNFEPEFPDEIKEEILQITGWGGASEEMAIAYILEKYKSGLALLKQDSNGVFKMLRTKEIISSTGIKSYLEINCE